MRAVYESGFTRVPVYHVRRSTVVGLVFTKVRLLSTRHGTPTSPVPPPPPSPAAPHHASAQDLILVDPHDQIPATFPTPFLPLPPQPGTPARPLLTPLRRP